MVTVCWLTPHLLISLVMSIANHEYGVWGEDIVLHNVMFWPAGQPGHPSWSEEELVTKKINKLVVHRSDELATSYEDQGVDNFRVQRIWNSSSVCSFCLAHAQHSITSYSFWKEGGGGGRW